jgi:hypothetical protein
MNAQGISTIALAATWTCCEIRLKVRPLAEALVRCFEPQLLGSCVPRVTADRAATTDDRRQESDLSCMALFVTTAAGDGNTDRECLINTRKNDSVYGRHPRNRARRGNLYFRLPTAAAGWSEVVARNSSGGNADGIDGTFRKPIGEGRHHPGWSSRCPESD